METTTADTPDSATVQRVTLALKRFPSLPDDAGVRVPVVAALTGSSIPTVWRWARTGRLPAPYKVGGITLWNVGKLRAAMKAMT